MEGLKVATLLALESGILTNLFPYDSQNYIMYNNEKGVHILHLGMVFRLSLIHTPLTRYTCGHSQASQLVEKDELICTAQHFATSFSNP